MSKPLIHKSSDDECSTVGEANDTMDEQEEDFNRIKISVTKLFKRKSMVDKRLLSLYGAKSKRIVFGGANGEYSGQDYADEVEPEKR